MKNPSSSILNYTGRLFGNPVSAWLYKHVFERQLNSIWGYLFLFLLTFMVSWLVVKVGWFIGILIAAAVIGGPILFSTVFKVEFGIKLMLIIAVFMSVFLKLLPNIPIGLVMDSTILMMMLGITYRAIKKGEWKPFQTPITGAILLWMCWHLIEIANPIAASRVAWFYVVRPAVGYILLFFAAYGYLNSITRIKGLVYLIVILFALSGIWGIVQFIFGYFPFEMEYIVSHDAVHLVYIQGRWRSFGTMGSPAQFGVIMAYTLIFCFVLVKVRFGKYSKLFMISSGIICTMALVYSGTRTGVALVPIGIMTIVGLSRSVKLYLICIFGGIIMIGIINMPTDNYHIKRIQSTFNASEDESYKVRERNKEMITPWILSHPMGGGLGSTGVWGQRFSPGTFLANFPPDSGYVRIAVEMGWIGLLIYIFLWINILIKSVFPYWKMKNPELKTIALSIFVSIVPLIVIESAQDIVGKLPSNLLFWVQLAILFRAIELDLNEQKELCEKTVK
ncbi:O-antigen ligase family protein [Flexithrix dorotheae]|uniref:O-antigen ligase family protein n=1 Tax=Flexithrix dorotheae TaxID=70993 RepID=UPI00036B389E|nr:O-antigen ligase family protein [Flexithrix dorotheae]